MAIYHMMGEQDIETALRFPWTSIGSDAGAVAKLGVPDETGLPHPRSFGNFPRVIARYVKERKVLTLEDAIRKMTSWPATRFRLANRVVTIDHGRHTGAKAGRVLRGPGYVSTEP